MDFSNASVTNDNFSTVEVTVETSKGNYTSYRETPKNIAGDRIYVASGTLMVKYDGILHLSKASLYPAVSVDSHSVTEGDADYKLMEFTVSLNRPIDEKRARVDYDIIDVTATAGRDYSPDRLSDRLVFNHGEDRKTIRVSVLGDSVPEGTETFIVNLSNLYFLELKNSSNGTGTIVDDDSPAVLDPLSPGGGGGGGGGGGRRFCIQKRRLRSFHQ